jgi:L-histidine Nalpha-methyltransferase
MMHQQILLETFAADVARDLQRTPKQLQSQYLYDDLGSSLFDAICRLPWYRITRAEERLLARHASRIVSELAGDRPVRIVELGVGSGEKLETLVEALPTMRDVEVHLIDISTAALEATEARLSRFPHVSLVRHRGRYEDGLKSLPAVSDPDVATLVLFLGSNIGNFDVPAARSLLRAVRGSLRRGDGLLLGADLVKSERELILAYDDPLGVTAAFNRNLLGRINRELDGCFDLSAFEHRAIWNDAEQRVEMHLVSRQRQDIEIRALDLRVHFEPGESIWTESSYKYTQGAIALLASSAGFSTAAQWIDADARFALSLLRV